MNKKLAIFCLATSWMAQTIPVSSRELTMCDGFGWGTDLQAHFLEYRVSICIYGMFPSRMVVYKDSNVTSQTDVKILNLEKVTSHVGGEAPDTTGRLPNELFYKARDGSVLYKLAVTKGRLAEFEVFVGGKLTYHRTTRDVTFVDLIPP